MDLHSAIAGDIDIYLVLAGAENCGGRHRHVVIAGAENWGGRHRHLFGDCWS